MGKKLSRIEPKPNLANVIRNTRDQESIGELERPFRHHASVSSIGS